MRLRDVGLLSYLVKRFRWALLTAALASVTSGACSVWLVAQINAALTADAADLGGLARSFAIAAVAVLIANLLSDILSERLRQRANAELQHFISMRVTNAPFRDLEQVGSAKVQAALSEHSASVGQFFVSLPSLLTNGASVLGCLVYLIVLSPRIFLLTLLLVALGSVGYHLTHLRAIRYLRAGAAEQDRLFGYFRSLTEGAKELRLNRCKRVFFNDEVLGRSIDTVRRQRMSGMTLFVAASNWGNFLIYAFLGVVLFVVADGLPDRERVLTGFALLVVYMVNPLQSLLHSIPNANLARVAAARIHELTRSIAPREPAAAHTMPASFRSLVLRGVKHRFYHEQSNEFFQLGPIDLAFHPGEVTFIVGGNGSGKTTLAKVLVGLYPPELGSILLNDEHIDDSNRDQYRQQFSAVFADFHLFESLLEERRKELDAWGSRLLVRLQLHHKVQLREGAFTTLALSHGQRKRLALVVAYLEDRPVLVFDEWAADQDPAFKNIFYHEILAELRALGKALIVISHDDRYFHLADRIIRLDNGQVLSEAKGQAPPAVRSSGVDCATLASDNAAGQSRMSMQWPTAPFTGSRTP
jgi:putative pyoverdin transport system ATP-binding/permease protein